MNKLLVILVVCLVSCNAGHSQRKYRIVVIGSSTVAGQGATPNPNPINSNNPPDSCWASIVLRYYKSFGVLDTLVNLGRSGTTTFWGLPSGSTYPDGTPMVANNYNVTSALVRFRADLVIVSYVSNDADSQYTVAQTMASLRTIYNTVVNAGKICYITTTQPRTNWTLGNANLNWARQREERDSILMEFGPHALNFYNPLVAADSNTINLIYKFDGTHVNNLGHRQLANVVENANILGEIVPLPLTLISFTATTQSHGIRLDWTVADEDGPVTFTIQRGKDGNSFQDIGHENVAQSAGTVNYTWTDQQPLGGKSFYRLKMSDAGGDHYSSIVSTSITANEWGFGKVFFDAGTSMLKVELLSPVNQKGMLTVTNAAGSRVLQRQVSFSSPSETLFVPLSGLANGEYFLRLVSDQGMITAKAFMKL